MIGTKVIVTHLIPDCNIAAITLFGLVFTRDKRFVDKYILNHELIHCQQQLEWLYLPFFVLYLAEWAWHFLKFRDIKRAYRAVSFEREAYNHDSDLHYLYRRKHYANYREKA